MEGEQTTAGCRAVAGRAAPALRDAACLAGARAAGARIVGRTNLHELALGVTGVNPWYGTPVNPLDPALVPGGSSSGSAVAVATGEADVAYGSDTGGSVRIPAACCGIAGLKTTWGRVPLDGVWPLCPEFRHGRSHGARRGRVGARHGTAPTGVHRGRHHRRHHRPPPSTGRPADRRGGQPGTARRGVVLPGPRGPRVGRRHPAGRPSPAGRGLGVEPGPGGSGSRGDRNRGPGAAGHGLDL